jgi:aerobic-type carbon monoxide dehydrogenase small subunit (CoxS/CutS family)
MIAVTVNGEARELDVAADTPLLWVLRDRLGLTGTKYGCGIALCGACIVHLDGKPVNACVTPIGSCAGKSVVTIEGLANGAGEASVGQIGASLQQAWIAEQVPQCGYCQSGQLMAATALLAEHPRPTDQQIDAAMDRVLCRCGTYNRVRRAIHRAASPTTKEV